MFLDGVGNIAKVEIPLLTASMTISKEFSYLYGIAILIAMITSAVSSGMRFYTKLFQKHKRTFIVYGWIVHN